MQEIRQPESGYRFSIDPFLLAGHVKPEGQNEILDIGCGCGIIPLLLIRKYPGLKITGIEIQAELAACARENFKKNAHRGSLEIIEADINNILNQDVICPKDIIVSNPPYQKKGAGRLNPDPQKAVARHELTLDAGQLVRAAGKLLKPTGILYLIYPFNRLHDIHKRLETNGFYLQWKTLVHSRPGENPSRVILCAGKEKKNAGYTRPFFIYNDKKQFSSQYLALFEK